MYNCEFCNKICKNLNSLVQHQIRCPDNKNRINFHRDGFKKFNLEPRLDLVGSFECKFCGLKFDNCHVLGGHSTLCEKNPSRTTTLNKRSISMTGLKWSEERKDKHKISMRKCVIEGRQRTPRPGGICKGSWYDKLDGTRCYLHGSWEVNIAKFFDQHSILWDRTPQSFDYIFKDELHKYYPDFYLPCFDLFVEVKGYETKKDHAKWEHFPRKLEVIRFHEYHNLIQWYRDILNKYQKQV